VTYNELKELVQHHCHLYYDVNRPEISDEEFDRIYDQLEKVEKAQGWSDADSPTIRVGGATGKVKHPHKLYSLNKVYDEAEIGEEFIVEAPKLDGANLTLIYEDGKLQMALTRGDGEFGENVTHLTPALRGVPEYAPDCIVNGECVTDNEVENFRNYVSGALGLLEVSEFRSRNIRFIAHELLGVQMNYTAKMKVLANAGFHTVFDEELCSKYPQDGLVYRIDDWQTCERLGYTSKYPRFAIALKERNSLVATTTLKEVLWTVGRTGAVNPTGLVEPVVLDGATVSRVTLHNMEFILSHDLGLGDLIQIERAGGVIPKFNEVIQHSSHNLKIEQRHAEAAVGHTLRRVGPRLYCEDGSQHDTVKLLEYFIKTIDIKGLGPASVTKMQLKHPADLYQSHDWSKLGANGIKVQDEIERSKTKPYEVVLASLGAPGVGKSMAKKIVQHIPSFNRLREIETVHITGIGPKRIEQILTWLDVNEDWVKKMPLQLEQNQSIDSVINSDGIRKICITGKLDMSRSELASHLEEKGFTVTSTVTKDCYALISGGDTTSSKYRKASGQGTNVVDYWENRNDILQGII
jgi:DNA ligase (NAD+)|tara:strand:- start:264 stop:1997 length:1734 start_codon:yes stop_codon:yes gene_type:complete